MELLQIVGSEAACIVHSFHKNVHDFIAIFTIHFPLLCNDWIHVKTKLGAHPVTSRISICMFWFIVSV